MNAGASGLAAFASTPCLAQRVPRADPESVSSKAARDGHSVRYQRLPRLLDDLAMGRAEGRYASMLARLAKIKLLILDDWLMAKLTSDQRRDLMEVIDDRHQRGSTVLATQIPLDRWHEQIGDPTYGDVTGHIPRSGGGALRRNLWMWRAGTCCRDEVAGVGPGIDLPFPAGFHDGHGRSVEAASFICPGAEPYEPGQNNMAQRPLGIVVGCR